MRTREEIIWAAGLFEGEGCFNIHQRQIGRFQATASLSSNDEDVVRKFRDCLGFGNIRGPYLGTNSKKPLWCWATTKHEHFQALVAMFWPFLGERRKKKAGEVLKAINEYTQAKSSAKGTVFSEALA